MMETETQDQMFRRSLNDKGLWIIEIQPDANCMYAALAQSVYRTASMQHVVRQDIYSVISRNLVKYKKLSLCNFQNQVEAIKDDGCRGSNLILHAASECYNCNIIVHQPEGGTVNIPEDMRYNETIALSCHNQFHYNLLTRIEIIMMEQRDGKAQKGNAQKGNVQKGLGITKYKKVNYTNKIHSIRIKYDGCIQKVPRCRQLMRCKRTFGLDE